MLRELLSDLHLGAVLGMLVAAKYLIYSNPPNSKPILFVLAMAYSFLKMGGEPLTRYVLIMVSGYFCFEACLKAERILEYCHERASNAAESFNASETMYQFLPSLDTVAEAVSSLWAKVSSPTRSSINGRAQTVPTDVQSGDKKAFVAPEALPRTGRIPSSSQETVNQQHNSRGVY